MPLLQGEQVKMAVEVEAQLLHPLCHYRELLLMLVSLSIFFFFFSSCKHGSTRRKNWPLVGMLPALLPHYHHLHDFLTHSLRAVGCNFTVRGLWFLSRDYLITCDLATVNHIFSTNYPKGDQYGEIFDILGDCILSSDDESWKVQRKMAHRILGDPRFRSFVAASLRDKVQHRLLPFLDHTAQSGAPVDMHDAFIRLIFDTTTNAVFGVDPQALSPALPSIPFAMAIQDVEEALHFRHIVPAYIWKTLKRLNIGQERKLNSAWAVIDQFIFQEIAKKRSADQSKHDLLTLYMNWPSADGSGNKNIDQYKSDKFLRDSAFALMAAGSGTIAATLSWLFYLIAKHPEVENKILEELTSFLGGTGCRSIFEHSQSPNSMVYLQAAVLETLRLYPSLPLDHKGAMKDDVLPNGMKVRSGMMILISIYAMGRIQEVWGEDCKKFKPERWISEDGRLRNYPSSKFMTFGTGPRACIGREYALVQVRTIAAALICNFHFELVEGQNIIPKNSVILYMENGCMVKVKKRAN